MTECAECGFSYEATTEIDLAATLRSFASSYRDELLGGVDDAALRARPSPGVWSAIEYACHVRDVLLVQRDRVIQALNEDTPDFAPMYRDERAVLARYAEESAADVAPQLTMAADLLATVYAALSPARLQRPCVYNWPEPAERDISWIGRHTVHEAQHHLLDLRWSLTHARA